MRELAAQRRGGQALERRAESRGVADRVQFTGPVEASELSAWVARAHWVCFPSRHEGFGLSLVEAMAVGCRVVAQPLPAFRALIRDDVDGHLLDFAEPGTAADALASLRDAGPRPDVGRVARVAAQAHDWSVRADAWDEAYARMRP